MRALFDTHALVWATTEPARLSAAARTVIANPQNELLVSAASAWEVSTKVRLGRWAEAEPLERDFLHGIELAGYRLLDLAVQVALRSGRLAGDHGDPFDRMLAAQALALDIPILSLDRKLDGFGIRRIW